jgi:outer membrane protein
VNKIALALAVAALMAGSASLNAQDLKIGFVSLDRILREAAPAVRAQKKLEKEFAPRDQEVQKLAKQVKDMQALMEKEAVTMSESQRRERESELARLSRDLQRVQREVREDANVRRNEELSVIVQRAQEVIKQIAEAEKFDLILQEAVYRSPRIDITDKVIKALADK